MTRKEQRSVYKNIRAVLLDMDGTILDTAKDLCGAACYAAKAVGLSPFTLEEYKKVISYGIRDMYMHLLSEKTDRKLQDEIIAIHLNYYPEHCTEESSYYPGMEQVLKTLAAKGMKLAVITNKTEKTAVKIADHYCADIPFLAIWGNDGVRPLKPDAQVGLLACEKLGVSPGEVLYVGDGNTDMKFAKNAGFVAVGAAWGYNTRQELLDNGADLVLESPLELLDILELE